MIYVFFPGEYGLWGECRMALRGLQGIVHNMRDKACKRHGFLHLPNKAGVLHDSAYHRCRCLRLFPLLQPPQGRILPMT
ncbi:hypothetical protein CO610_00210 [Lysobacteraceae bacterium NML95-0200]|nr:hypothetical protein CO610_00210 [Xanthomonadaceae bacterium NML95-0200]